MDALLKLIDAGYRPEITASRTDAGCYDLDVFKGSSKVAIYASAVDAKEVCDGLEWAVKKLIVRGKA